jgi:hypothetical protein
VRSAPRCHCRIWLLARSQHTLSSPHQQFTSVRAACSSLRRAQSSRTWTGNPGPFGRIQHLSAQVPIFTESFSNSPAQHHQRDHHPPEALSHLIGDLEIVTLTPAPFVEALWVRTGCDCSLTSAARQGIYHNSGVAQIFENEVGAKCLKFRKVVTPCRYQEAMCVTGACTFEISRRIADDPGLVR